MVPSRIISADSHMLEPPDLWTTRLDKKYRDQAPHVEDNERGSYFIAPGLKPYKQHEYTLGMDYQLSRTLAFEARYDRRRLRDADRFG